jgi:hypothetical protein
MLKLLERNIASAARRLVLLAPAHVTIPEYFRNVTVDGGRHDELVREMQRLRGSIYLHDGALTREQLSGDGLHQTPEDQASWHFLFMNPSERRVSSCMWYREHSNAVSVEQLRVWNGPLMRLQGWRGKVVRGIESDLRRARQEFVHYAEAGGWAVCEESRCTPEGLMLPLGAYALSRIFGGGLGLATATFRHSSASILRRLGLSPLEADGSSVPPYFDPKYDCQMELLRFDTRRPNPKYLGAIEMFMQQLTSVPVIARHAAAIVRPYVVAEEAVA